MRINERCIDFSDCTRAPEAVIPCGQNTDPRLTAELTCPLSLLQTMGRSALQDGWNLLDLSLGSRRAAVYEAEIKAKFEEAKRDRPHSQDSFSAQMALDCSPLFAARAQGQIPNTEAYATAYYNLAKTIQQLDAVPPEAILTKHRVGITAEYVAEALLIRGKKEAYPASYRSDKSDKSRYNHDVEVFTDQGKIPVQIKNLLITGGGKRTGAPSVVATSRHGIRTVSMSLFIESASEDIHRKDKNTQLPEATVAQVAKLIAEEANQPFHPESAEAQLLDSLSETLYDAITDTEDINVLTPGAWEASAALNQLVRKRSDSSGNVIGKMNQPLTLRVATKRADTLMIPFDTIELRTTKLRKGMPAQEALAIAALHGEYLDIEDIDTRSEEITTSLILRSGEDVTFQEGFTVDVIRKQLLDAPQNLPLFMRLLQRLQKSKQEINWEKPAHLR